MDEAAIWNRALTGAEALALYTALAVPEPPSAALLVLGALAGLLIRHRRGGYHRYFGTRGQACVLAAAQEVRLDCEYYRVCEKGS